MTIVYADLDFILALSKEEDWLKQRAEQIYNKHRVEIWTSQLAIEESLLYSKKLNMNALDLISEIYDLIEVKNIVMNIQVYAEAAFIMNKYNATVFDSMHAIAAKNDGTIISSDSIYDKIGLKRIKLEERS